jgi:hypothetical protein
MSRTLKLRLLFALLIAITAIAGLAVRSMKHRYPWLADEGGDALWATMTFFIISFLWPTATLAWRIAAALGFSFAIEFSQLYHRPWIDRIRATTIGGMILGSSFDWQDLIAYVAGVGAGVFAERGTRR